MDFDEQAVRTDRDGAAAENLDQIGASASLARIDDDRQVGFLLGDGDGGQVEGVAGVVLEGADAALAKNHVRVAMGQNVFGGQQPLFDAHAHAAFEENRLAAARAGDEKLEVLGVAGADLQDVGRGCDQFDVVFAENLGDDAQAGCFACGGQQLQALGTESLEFVGGGARLVSATAQDGRAGGLDRMRGAHELFFAFHRAWTGHEDKFVPADFDAPGIDHGSLGPRFAAGQFVAFLHAQDAFDLGQGGQGFETRVRGFVADRGDHSLELAADRARGVTEFGDLADDLLHLFGRSVRTDNDNHERTAR